jgi:hypothetical protein
VDVGHAMENAGAFGRDGLEQQPGNGGRIGGAAFQTAGDHFAATVALPSGAGVVNADFPVIVGVGVPRCMSALKVVTLTAFSASR